MARKRRTRAQKIRASRNRKFTQVYTTITKLTAVSKQIKQPESVVNHALTKSVNMSTKSFSNRHDLIMSLMIFGSLIAIQFILWFIFRLTQIDDSLYSKITL